MRSLRRSLLPRHSISSPDFVLVPQHFKCSQCNRKLSTVRGMRGSITLDARSATFLFIRESDQCNPTSP